MRIFMLIVALPLATSLLQGSELPLSAQAVPGVFCFVSDFVSFTRILSEEVTPCRQRQKR